MAEVKHYEVTRDARRVLTFSAEPGVLLSTAMRPPGFKPPAHPFVNAQAHDARHEQTLGALLGQSQSVTDFIAKLEGAGFEVFPA